MQSYERRMRVFDLGESAGRPDHPDRVVFHCLDGSGKEPRPHFLRYKCLPCRRAKCDLGEPERQLKSPLGIVYKPWGIQEIFGSRLTG